MKKTILVAAVMFLGLTAAAFAQATYSVGSIPVTTVTATGQTERSGDITFTQISGISNAGTITITYGVPITVPFSAVSAIGTGGYAGLVSVNASSNNAAGVLIVNVPAGVSIPATITVTGVRVAVAGTGLTSLVANISSTGNALVAGQTSVVVISAIAAGIASVESDDPGKVNAVDGSIPVQPTIKIKEGYLAAYLPQGSGDTTSVCLRITMSAAPPSNVRITFPATVGPLTGGSTWQTASSTGAADGTAKAFTSSSTSLSVYYRIVTATDPTLQETFIVSPTIDITGTPTYPLTSAVVTYLVSLAPVGIALKSDGTVDTSLPIPRFAASDIGPNTLFSVVGSTTSILIPFASTVTASGYNSGFSIANTTKDPDVSGFDPPVVQSGTLTFYMYPQLATPGGTLAAPYVYTTSGTSPGTGLDTAGKVPSGSSYTVLLSQLLSAAGAPADFQGYIIVLANFTNAHCLYVLTDFAGFTQGSLGLVINGDRDGLAEALDN